MVSPIKQVYIISNLHIGGDYPTFLAETDSLQGKWKAFINDPMEAVVKLNKIVKVVINY